MNNQFETSILKPFKIKGDKHHPMIMLDKEANQFEFSGVSMPDHAAECYYPVVEWFRYYKLSPNPVTELVFKLDYIDRASSDMMGNLFEELKSITDAGHTVRIKWYYYFDDDDMLAEGSAFAKKYPYPFEFIGYKN